MATKFFIEKDKKIYGNALQVNLRFENPTNSVFHTSHLSSEYVLCGLVKFQVKSDSFSMTSQRNAYGQVNNQQTKQFISIKLTKLFDDKVNYKVTVRSTYTAHGGNPPAKEHSTCEYSTTDDNTSWRIIHETSTLFSSIDMHVYLDVASSPPAFASLHEDTELTDFELTGEDGSVRVHKAVLSGYSPVMKAMLSGDWKEASTGAVMVPNTTKKTLQHFKNYMYLNTLPNEGAEQLAVLASYYMMPDLVKYCTMRLLSNLSAETAAELLKFAVRHDLNELVLGILENVQTGCINVEDMIKIFCASEAKQKAPNNPVNKEVVECVSGDLSDSFRNLFRVLRE